MIKFSTRTNYRLVQIAHFVVVNILRITLKNVSQVVVKRNQIHWSLNLNEVIDFLIYLTGAFDREGIDAFSQKLSEKDVVIDIGANIGSVSLNLAKKVTSGHIYAVEPSQYAYQRLYNNLSLNKNFENTVTPIQAFITSADVAPKEVYASWNMASTKENHEKHMGILTETTGSSFISLDDLIDKLNLSTVNWIKIDVDGYEESVLNGAVRTFTQLQPNLFIELSEYPLLEQNSSVEKILNLLISYGYHFYSVSNVYLGQDVQKIKQLIPNLGAVNVFAYVETNQ